MAGCLQYSMISLTLTSCLALTAQHQQSMSRRVKRLISWSLQPLALRKNIAVWPSHHHYLRREFSYSNYEQSYTLPDDVVKDQISAKVEDGILTVTMPKTEPKQKVTKAIEVS